MYEKYLEYLKNNLKENRYKHSLNVASKAKYLAKKYDFDEEKAYFAGLLHDCTKNETDEKQLQIFNEFGIILDNVQREQKKLWHSISGAAVVKHKFNINDVEIIDAIRYHTTGRENMTKLDKIIYLADFISDERDFDGVDELRKFAEIDLDLAVFECLKFSISELTDIDKPIHLDTVAAYNYLSIKRKDF